MYKSKEIVEYFLVSRKAIKNSLLKGKKENNDNDSFQTQNR